MAEFLCGIETPELRKPPSPTLKEFYTRETLDAVNRLCEKDFALFGYERL